MSGWYTLWYDNVQLGDELVVAMSAWRASVTPGQRGAGAVLEPLVKVDDQPLAVVLYPTFRLRKTFDHPLKFERWVFDLATWADGVTRWLMVCNEFGGLVGEYGYCKLLSLSRPKPSGPDEANWSDQVILTFQSDTIPTFHNLD